MTVKKLSPVQKEILVAQHQAGKTINELATLWTTSRRTVIRVLEEKFIDPGIRRRQRKPTPITPVIVTQQPWYVRAGRYLQDLWSRFVNA